MADNNYNGIIILLRFGVEICILTFSYKIEQEKSFSSLNQNVTWYNSFHHLSNFNCLRFGSRCDIV